MKALLICLALLAASCAGDDATATTQPPAAPTTSVAQPTSSTSPDTTASAGFTSSSTSTSAAPTSTTLAPLLAIEYQPVAEIEFPIFLTSRPGEGTALLAQRSGLVRILAGGEVGDVILDISNQITTGGERGLLGVALHPSDPSRLYLHYSDTAGDTVVSEFTFEGETVDPESERVLLTVDQPAPNHNGGMIQFGPDGSLYLGLGDGGGAGDQFGNGQNLDTLLGGIVRIEVDSANAELWQYGLRNPWRFWIDGEDMWIADVGQDSYEEVDLAPITAQGINYGWPVMEGLHCFQAAGCDADGLHLPILEVEQGDAGTCSITGGVVYQGRAIPEYHGRFFFSDYCGGYLRSTDRAGSVTDHTDEVGVPGQVVSFGVDGQQEMYVLTMDRILKIVPVR